MGAVARETRQARRTPDVLELESCQRPDRATALVFRDPASRALSERIGRIAPSEATVLIVGETGTGKELVARDVHRRSLRVGRPFIAINCAALPEQIVESELFGHERGAFTGADAQRRGWFETASGGTLFLDEMGDLPLSMQVKLLRVLQEREVNRLGSRVPIPIDVRIIAATNVHLEEAVREGRFREDLYYRLAVARLNLQPLRERPGDILPLARHFLDLHARSLPGQAEDFSAEAEQSLLAYHWPGNIRELENVVQQARLIATGRVIGAADLNLAPLIPTQDEADGLEGAFDGLLNSGAENIHSEVEERLLRHTLRRTGSNQLQTARLLGITRNVLRHRMKSYGLL
jgi:sigma-54-specific transcriptional regulator